MTLSSSTSYPPNHGGICEVQAIGSKARCFQGHLPYIVLCKKVCGSPLGLPPRYDIRMGYVAGLIFLLFLFAPELVLGVFLALVLALIRLPDDILEWTRRRKERQNRPPDVP